MFAILMSAKIKALFAGYLLSTSVMIAAPGDPTQPHSFNTSLYITKANKIRLAVEKTTGELVTISLRPVGSGLPYVFSQSMRKKQTRLALQLDVNSLTDGVYELEVKSATGRMTRQLTLATPACPNEAVSKIILPSLSGTDDLLSVK